MDEPLTNSHVLGFIGECLVAKYLGAIPSTDQFDSEKDLTLPDGSTIEVKTQNRFRKLNAFTVKADKSTNLNKCLSVDKLLFVEFDWGDTIQIWDCVDRNYYTTKTSQGEMACWPIEKMNLLHVHTSSKLAYEMRKLSNAKEFKL